MTELPRSLLPSENSDRRAGWAGWGSFSWRGSRASSVKDWARIVAKYDLRTPDLRDLVGYGEQHADFAFAYGATAGPRAFVSTVQLRRAGFTTVIDTEDSFRNALQSLIDR